MSDPYEKIFYHRYPTNIMPIYNYLCGIMIVLLIVAGLAYIIGSNKIGDTLLDVIRWIIIVSLIIVLIILILFLIGPLDLSDYGLSFFHPSLGSVDFRIS